MAGAVPERTYLTVPGNFALQLILSINPSDDARQDHYCRKFSWCDMRYRNVQCQNALLMPASLGFGNSYRYVLLIPVR